MYKTVHALVLREAKFKEADKMLTVLTMEEGKLSVRARGALRKSCRFSAAAQPLAYSEMTLFGNRGRYLIQEASVIELFSGLGEDFGALALATYFAELLEAVSDEDSPDPNMLRLGLNSLFALSRSLYPGWQIKAVFELRAMCLAGYEPETGACALCGAVDITHPIFDLTNGCVLCGECARRERRGGEALCPASLTALRHIVSAELKRVFSFALTDEQARRHLERVCERYVHVQLDRGFGALEYYKKWI